MRSISALAGIAGAATLLLASVALAQTPEEREQRAQEQIVQTLLRTGRSYLAHREFGKAERLLRKLLAVHPQNQEAVAGLTEALSGQGRHLEAIECVNAALEDAPGSVLLRFSLAKALLTQGKSEDAARLFEQVQREKPDWPNIASWVGTAYLQCGRTPEALDQLQQARPATRDAELATRMTEAVALWRLGQTREAQRRLEGVRTEAPDTPMAELADQLSRRLVAPVEPLRLSLRLTGRYDDNVALVPTDNVFGLREQSHRSWGNQADLSAFYDLSRGDGHQFELGYAAQQILNYSNHGTDLHSDTLYLTGRWFGSLGTRPYQVEIANSYAYLLVNEHSFLQRASSTPSFTYSWTDWTSTTVSAGYSWSDFLRQRHVDGTPSDRDADSALGGVSQAFRLPWQGITLRAGYQFTHSFAEGDNYDLDQHKARWSLTWPMPIDELRLDVVGEHTFRRHEHEDSGFLERRRDAEHSIRTTLTIPIAERWDLAVEYLYDRTYSTLDVYDNGRNAYSLAIEVRF